MCGMLYVAQPVSLSCSVVKWICLVNLHNPAVPSYPGFMSLKHVPISFPAAVVTVFPSADFILISIFRA